MRLILIVALLSVTLVGRSRADDPYIHAPSPPYCSPRGGEPDCISVDPWRSRGKFQERWLSQTELNAVDIGDIAEFTPNVWVAHPLEEHEEWFIFLGSAKLTLFGPEGGDPKVARIELESRKALSEKRARRLKRGFRSPLSSPTLEYVEVVRYASKSREDVEDDWCEFDRELPDKKWVVYCDVE